MELNRIYRLVKGAITVILLALLGACQAQTQQALTATSTVLGGPGAESMAALSGPFTGWLKAHESEGLILLNASGAMVTTAEGSYELLDSRPQITLDNQTVALVLSVNVQTKVPTVFAVSAQGDIEAVGELPVPTYQVEGLCLYRDEDKNLHGFLLDGAGTADQWLLYDGAAAKLATIKVRSMAVAPGSEHCAVDDASGRLYVTEETFGIWQYAADAEAEQDRELLDAVAPFGSLSGTVAGVATFNGAVVALTPETQQAHLYRRKADQWHKESIALADAEQPETVAALADGSQLYLAIYDDAREHNRLYNKKLRRALARKKADAAVGSEYVRVKPSAETAAVNRFGDAADDPAIWVSSQDAHASLILGTDKKWGLRVYNLQGEEVQAIPTGHVNNVDLRQSVKTDNGLRDIAVASNRSNNTIAVYDIDRKTGIVSEIGSIATELDEIYGICLYLQGQDQLFAFVNDKDGRFQQFRVAVAGGQVTGEAVREFSLETQPEACVADDRTGMLYLGEEDRGVWWTNANPQHTAAPELIIEVGQVLKDDVEGLALYHRQQGSYLVVSSQGDNSYAIFSVADDYRHLGSFRIAANVAAGIDGASETDGLAVTNADLGGVYGQGLLVVQDGRNVMPHQPQNFKLISWAYVAEALGLQD